MIKIEKVDICGLEPAIRGMRNPMNSWDRSDSGIGCKNGTCEECNFKPEYCGNNIVYTAGPNDLELMQKLANGGPVHAKYRRMITVYMDITAPLYWWKEFDTYKVGTVANSCSTMHKIADKEFTLHDFSCEHLTSNGAIEEPRSNNNWDAAGAMLHIIDVLNYFRDHFVAHPENKTYWWQMIQLLPSSYNQRRTVMLNYEVLVGIYKYRKDHKLDEWREFCKWIETLPMSEIITGYHVTKLVAANDDGKDIVLSDGSVSVEEVAFEAIINKQTAMDAVIHAHKSGLIGAATFAKLVRVCDTNDQLDQLAEYIGYTLSLDDACAESDERGDVRDV